MVVYLEIGGILQIHKRQIASNLPHLQLHNVIRFLVAEKYQFDAINLDNNNNLTVKYKFVVKLVHSIGIGYSIGINGVGEVNLKAGKKTENVVNNCVLVYRIVELGQ